MTLICVICGHLDHKTWTCNAPVLTANGLESCQCSMSVPGPPGSKAEGEDAEDTTA